MSAKIDSIIGNISNQLDNELSNNPEASNSSDQQTSKHTEIVEDSNH